MHFTFPPEGFAAAVLTDISPSWFLTQAVSNYFLNNKQSACKPPLLAVDVCRAGREEGMVHVTITQSNHFFIKIRRTTCPGLPILWFACFLHPRQLSCSTAPACSAAAHSASPRVEEQEYTGRQEVQVRDSSGARLRSRQSSEVGPSLPQARWVFSPSPERPWVRDRY